LLVPAWDRAASRTRPARAGVQLVARDVLDRAVRVLGLPFADDDYEGAKAVRAMLDRGLTGGGAAQALGWPKARVTARVKVLELAERAQQLIGEGVIAWAATDELRAIGTVAPDLLDQAHRSGRATVRRRCGETRRRARSRRCAPRPGPASPAARSAPARGGVVAGRRTRKYHEVRARPVQQARRRRLRLPIRQLRRAAHRNPSSTRQLPAGRLHRPRHEGEPRRGRAGGGCGAPRLGAVGPWAQHPAKRARAGKEASRPHAREAADTTTRNTAETPR
jgi:hypothetical protein